MWMEAGLLTRYTCINEERTNDLVKELQLFVQGRLAKHEYPRKIQFVTELPKTTTGKIKRRDLRAMEGISPKLRKEGK